MSGKNGLAFYLRGGIKKGNCTDPGRLYLVKILPHFGWGQGRIPLSRWHGPWSASWPNSALCKGSNGAGIFKAVERGKEPGWENRKGYATEMIIESWQLPNTLCPWQHLLSVPQRWRVRWRKTAVYMPTAAGCCAGLVLCQQKMCQTRWPCFKWLGVDLVCQGIRPGTTFALTPLSHLPLLLPPPPPHPSPATHDIVPLPRMSSSGCFSEPVFQWNMR